MVENVRFETEQGPDEETCVSRKDITNPAAGWLEGVVEQGGN